MYNEHFGLQQAPFRITPDTRLFYEGGGRGEILDALVYAIVSGEGIVKVVGEVGTGKTMLCRMLEERLPENVEIVYLANPSLKPDDILQAIALEMDLDIAPNSNRLKVMHAMQQRLLEKHASNRQVVVFVEEAQSMPIETLEEIRLLSNLETKREKLLQIVLFGQPELDENLNQANIRQLKERITHSFYLEPLNRNEIRDYVNFRMRAVGYKGPDVFRSNAYLSMTRASEGLTRRINILADKALLAAYANDRHDVRLKDVRKAINDSQFEQRRRRWLTLAAATVGVLLLAGAVGWSVFEPLGQIGGSGERTVGAASPEADATAAVKATDSIQAAAVAVEPKPVKAEPVAAEPVQADPKAPAIARSAVAAKPMAPAAAQSDVIAEPMQSAGASAPVEPGPDPFARESAATGRDQGEPAEVTPGIQLIAAAARAAMLSPKESPIREPAEMQPAAWDAPADSAGMSLPTTASQSLATGVAASHSTDFIAARLAATREWLARADHRHYSIQLLLTAQSQRRHVEEFLEQRYRGGEIQRVYVYETIIDDRPYLGVLYGEYSGYSAAKRALEDLPMDLKRLGPFIRNLRDVSSVG